MAFANPDFTEWKPLKNRTAPEHVHYGVDHAEFLEIASEFRAARALLQSDGTLESNIFSDPAKHEIIRLAHKARAYELQHGWMTIAEAQAKVATWRQHAAKQYLNPVTRALNQDKVVLSLFDKSGQWAKPWADAGYQVIQFDIQSDPNWGNVNNFSVEFFNEYFDILDGKQVYAILAACPCTDFASSGARHFAAKDADGRTVASIKLVHQTIRTIEYFRPVIWSLENPVGRIERLGGLPKWRLAFDPNHLGDPYTKKTLLWGRFNADLPIAPVFPTEGSKMHTQYGGKGQKTKDARSVTPEGFAYGFFMANNAADHPGMALANEYDRLDRVLFDKAIQAGRSVYDIKMAIDDYYYMDLDDDAANEALASLAS